MLPSVGAGSAALTKYAQAAVTASGNTARNHEQPARTDQEAGAHQEQRGAVRTADETLARETRAAVTALLDLLHSRVFDALSETGLPTNLASDAADRAVAALAASIVNDSEHAARIVQAVLDHLESGAPATDRALLRLAAKGLTVSIDRLTGAIDVAAPDVRLQGAPAPGAAAAGPTGVHHLLDFTDGNEAKIAPVIAAFEAVRAAAADASALRETSDRAEAGRSTAPALVVAPNAFARAFTQAIRNELPETAATAKETGAVVSRIVADAISRGPAADGSTSVRTVAASISSLRAVAVIRSDGPETYRLTSPDLDIAFRPADGSVRVRIGERIIAYAPASLPANAAPNAAAGIEAASIPVRDISPGMPVGKVLDEPTGVPFVPPEIDDLPTDRRNPEDPATKPLLNSAARTAMEDDLFRMLETAPAAGHTILRAVDIAGAPELATGISRVSLDLVAAVGAGPTSAVQARDNGRLGRSTPAAAQGENGPVDPNGSPDGASTKPPVLPAWHAVGALAGAAAPPQTEPAKTRRLPPRGYRRQQEDDAFTRGMPSDFEGFVFASVAFDA